MALLGRDTSITGPLPEGALLLESLTGREALGVPYLFSLVLLSEDPNIDADAVLGQPLAVGIKLNNGGERFFHGVVTAFDKVGATRLHTRYTATLRPTLYLFDYTSDCRIFNQPNQNAVDIVTEVLAARGLTDVESGSIKDHPFLEREYCVQYRESDLKFVQRLLEEEGIYYFHRHEKTKHTLVMADSVVPHKTPMATRA